MYLYSFYLILYFRTAKCKLDFLINSRINISIVCIYVISSFYCNINRSFIYKFSLSVWVFFFLLWCLFVCLYPINVKTAEPMGPKFFVGHHVTPGKVYKRSKLKKLFLKVFYLCKNFENFENPRIFLIQSVKFYSWF